MRVIATPIQVAGIARPRFVCLSYGGAEDLRAYDVNVPRKDMAPVWTRSFPVSKQPQRIGQHLRKRRFELGIRQIEAARRLGVSDRTLSLWECDRAPPVWANQPRIIAYLGYDPFTDPTFGRPRGNETIGVAFLSQSGPLSLGQQIMKRRMELRKNRKQCAQEIGISVKALWALETNRRRPNSALLKRLLKCLGLHVETSFRQAVL